MKMHLFCANREGLCENRAAMGLSRKKAIVRTVEDELFTGYLPVAGFAANGLIEMLDLDGRIASIPSQRVRTIAYVRDFNLRTANPEQLTRRTFLARPRSEGLWVRLVLENDDQLEGLAALDASLLDGLLDDAGVFLTPPDVRCNTQRVFVPRTAIKEFHVVAVVTTPSRKEKAMQPGRSGTGDLPFPPG